MRLETELPDHPKYKRLKRLVGECALEALIRLWGHCQQSQRGELWPGADVEYVELVCHWDGEAGLLYRSLRDTGWLKEMDGGVMVHEWEHHNRNIVANWMHGTRGGRPRKPTANPVVSGENEVGQNGASKNDSAKSAHIYSNPPQTHGLTVDNPLQTHCKPAQPNLTKPNLTTGGDGGDEVEKPTANPPETHGLAVGLRYDLAKEVLKFLNEKTGSSFPESPAALHTIACRLQEVNQDLSGILQMITRQAACWSLDEMKNFLRPATLFHEQKFSDYYGQRKLPMPKASRGARKDELLALIEKSPANRESVYHSLAASAEEKEKLRAWREELRKS